MEKLVFTALLRQLGKRWVFPGRKRGTRLANLTASWAHRSQGGLSRTCEFVISVTVVHLYRNRSVMG